jgi:hypothetical protein
MARLSSTRYGGRSADGAAVGVAEAEQVSGAWRPGYCPGPYLAGSSGWGMKTLDLQRYQTRLKVKQETPLILWSAGLPCYETK